jgi:small subunit ribosomal protein S4
MLSILERRLDNLVYRFGFAGSRSDARQLLRHGHIKVNGRRVDIPSYVASVGDTIEVTDKGRKFKRVEGGLEGVDKRPMLSWLNLDKENFTGTVKASPVREELNEPLIDEQLVVEYYSR